MGVEGDDIGNAHILKLLQGQGAVQRLTAGTAVLAALIEEGNDHIDAVRLYRWQRK